MPSHNLQNRVIDAYLYLFAAIAAPVLLEVVSLLVIVSVMSDSLYDRKSAQAWTLGLWIVFLVAMVLVHIVLVIWRLVRLDEAKRQLRLVRDFYEAALDAMRDAPPKTAMEFTTLNGVAFQVTQLPQSQVRIVVNPAAMVRRMYQLTSDSVEDVSRVPLGIAPSQITALTSALRTAAGHESVSTSE